VQGPYQIVQPLGESPYGFVHLAADSFGRRVCLTALRPEVAADPQVRWQFAQYVNSHAATPGPTPVVAADLNAPVPWAATANPELPGGENLLIAMGGGYTPLAAVPPPVSAPAYAPAAPAGTPLGVKLGVVAAVVAVLAMAGAGAAYVVTSDDKPTAGPSPTPAASRSPSPSPSPSASPSATPSAKPTESAVVQPGGEPPKPGAWPASWASFTAGEATYDMSKLKESLGFGFRTPKTWGCLRYETPAGYLAKHVCVDESYKGTGGSPGGQILVRECKAPCDAAVQTSQRADVHAFAAQWMQGDATSTYAEGTGEFSSGKRYFLVVSRYWRSRPGGPLDRQLVFRMTATEDRAGELQKTFKDIQANTPA